MKKTILVGFVFLTSLAQAWFIEGELGPVWQSLNNVQIPGTTGTRFNLKDFGSGPFLAGRIYIGYDWTEKSEFRALFAPLSIRGSKTLTSDISFQDQVFTSGQTIQTLYRFNSYRMTYRYRLLKSPDWRFWIGFTAKVRDAEIALSRETVTASKKDLGFVPLLHFRLLYQASEKVSFDLEADALAAPQGRAEDIVLRTRYELAPGWIANLGYRILEGGADNDRVYAFAFLHYLVAGLEVRF